MQGDHRQRLFQLASTAFVIVGFAPLVLALALSTDGEQVTLLGEPITVECAFKTRTSVPCGSCGLTRAWIRAAHGDLDGARNLHPQGPEILAAYLWTISALAGLVWAQRKRSSRARWLAGLALLVGIVLLGLAFRPTVINNMLLRQQFPLHSSSAGHRTPLRAAPSSDAVLLTGSAAGLLEAAYTCPPGPGSRQPSTDEPQQLNHT